jgi:formate--tetrahydrofolate ligase
VPTGRPLAASRGCRRDHGGIDLKYLDKEDPESLRAGCANLERHVENLKDHFGLPVLVALNRFSSDRDSEIALVTEILAHRGVRVVPSDHWARGGEGAEELARTVVELCSGEAPEPRHLYDEKLPLWEKIECVARLIHRASGITADPKVRAQLERFEEDGYGHLPICIAKTQYSFSTDPRLRGAPEGHVIPIREVRLAAGAGFVVAICGDIMTMPGLPASPAALRIDVGADGRITGLS